MKAKLKLGIAVAALAAAAALLLLVWYTHRPQPPQEGEKTITVQVLHKDGTQCDFVYRTEAQLLGELLLEDGLITGEEGEFGLYITSADGEVADFSVDGGWWRLSKDGEMTTTGISATPLADGDHFELTYTCG